MLSLPGNMRLFFVILALQVAVGQTTERTISVAVTRTVAVRFDEVTVAINVTADAAADLDGVLDGLAFAGVRGVELVEWDLAGDGFTYRFRFTRRAEKFGEILFGLRDLQGNHPDWMRSLSFALGLSVSGRQMDELRRSQLSSVEQEGRKAAERLAAPMGVRVGAMQASDQPGVFAVPILGARWFNTLAVSDSVPWIAPSTNRAVFQFQLSFALESL